MNSINKTTRPTRIQRRRTKGWRMPPNTVSVCRPGQWGNPFIFSNGQIYCDASHRRPRFHHWVLWHDQLYTTAQARAAIITLYRRWVTGTLPAHNYQGAHRVRPCPFTPAGIKATLKGKNLACFCPAHLPCHADVLLEIANS